MEVSRVGNFIYKFPKRTGCKFNQLMVRYSLTLTILQEYIEMSISMLVSFMSAQT